jgi:hypothetical protein
MLRVLRSGPRPERRNAMSARMSAIEGISGFVMLRLSFVESDPLQTNAVSGPIAFVALRLTTSSYLVGNRQIADIGAVQ